MKTVIIVSKCTEIAFYPTRWYTFSFNGFACSQPIRKVELKADKEFSIEVGKEYLMYVEMEEIDRGILVGKILKAKELDECWDKA